MGAFLFPLDNINGIFISIEGLYIYIFFFNLNCFSKGSKNLPDKNDMIVESQFLEKVDHILNDMNMNDFLSIKESLKS